MTDKEINVAIAEHLGVSVHPMDKARGEDCKAPWHGIPDYCNDLNAMHEAEKTLNGGKINTYLGYLYESNQAGILSPNLWERIAVRRSTHATSRKRAESFLKTIDKWKEQQ